MAAKNKATARAAAFGLFKDIETDWAFRRTLEYMNEKAAEIGECLYVARRINERDSETWTTEWRALAERVEAFAAKALDEGHLTSAREAYMRAANYYRTAEYGTSPSHPQFHWLWQQSVTCFRHAAALYSPPVQVVEVQFEGKVLPGYFWRPQADDQTRPTLIAAGGNDSALEEVFWTAGPAAVRRGYNFFAFEHPGHRGALHLYNDCIKRPDYEAPYRAAIDLLETLPGVDERLALTGYSFGGYIACRVASHEARIKAVVPNSPIVDAYEVSAAFWNVEKMIKLLETVPASVITWLYNAKMRKSPVQLALKQYTDWTGGMYPHNMTAAEKFKAGMDFIKPFTVRDRLDHITCPTLALVSTADGDVLRRQAQEMLDRIPAQKKQLHLFTLEKDGAEDHCQLDNTSRGAQVMFDWLDDVFDYRPAPDPAAVPEPVAALFV